MKSATAAPAGLAPPPRVAAVAGVISGVLLIVSVAIIRSLVPADPLAPGSQLDSAAGRQWAHLALNLIPFAGIAFIWFMGVLRARLGAQEDQFFATVMIASGLLFLAMFFAAAAIGGAGLTLLGARAGPVAEDDAYALVRAMGYVFMNVFAIKMAAVFMISTCTIGLKTGIMPRWIAFVGYACAVVLLLVITDWPWIVLVFPAWLLLLSAYVLIEDLRGMR
jgi:hypothetical protein